MNDAWATDWLGRFSGNEPTSLIELYAEDARFEDITLRHAVRGRPALREFFGAFMNPAHRHNTFTFISYSGNAHGGAIEWTWTARHRAPFLDLPAEGKETRIRGVSVVRFKAEKIVEQRDYWDARTLIRQLDGGAGEA
jgi:steroid delta-isomerase-like uncharacterized protein